VYDEVYFGNVAKFYNAGGGVVKAGKILERLPDGSVRFDEIRKFEGGV